MLRRAMWVALVVGLVGLAFTRTASAEERTIVGKLTAAAPEAEEAATVKTRHGGEVYKVTKDENGKAAAKGANNENVEIKGDVTEKEHVKWITVISCKIVE